MMKTIIVWFRNDLRVHDLPMLALAAREADILVPVFIFDEKVTNGERSSANRNRFLLESLEDLRTSLRNLSGDLLIRYGSAKEQLAALAKETGARMIYYTVDYTPYACSRDRSIAKTLALEDIVCKGFPGRLAVDTVASITSGTNQPLRVFTPFWRRWSMVPRRPIAPTPQHITLPKSIDMGTLPALEDIAAPDQLSPDTLPGGESAGRERLQQFIENGAADYHKDNNDMGADATSRLSAYLHFGCLSTREIEARLPDGEGPNAFRRQLAWRDFYDYILLHFPNNLIQEFQVRYRDFVWETDQRLLEAWQSGQTGYPIVDAAMRQLKQEGWMHNRARLIVGSFLTKDLALDWRLGEAHFMRWLCDGDIANNNGNWQWIASVGVDPAPVFRRLYNPTSQAKTYDPDGTYIRRYVPELASVSDKYLSEPWKMSSMEQEKANCIIDQDYPSPIIDHAVARRVALERYRAY